MGVYFHASAPDATPGMVISVVVQRRRLESTSSRPTEDGTENGTKGQEIDFPILDEMFGYPLTCCALLFFRPLFFLPSLLFPGDVATAS